jgi:hypothetical protein
MDAALFGSYFFEQTVVGWRDDPSPNDASLAVFIRPFAIQEARKNPLRWFDIHACV